MTPHLPEANERTYPLAKVMFWVAFLELLIVAGILHRAGSIQVIRNDLQIFDVEQAILFYGHLSLWPLIALETWIAFFIRNRVLRPFFPTFFRALCITVIPPLRMGMPCPWTGKLWIPFLGWCERGKPLEDRLERAFLKPMLVFALLILPVLGFEFVQKETVQQNPGLALALHAGVALIWVAFAFEFIIKVSAVRRPFIYSKERWLDLAIVLLPTLEFILTAWSDAAPLARLLRITRAFAPEQIARMGQIYRLRGLLMKGWRAFLVLRVVARLTGNTLEKQLRSLEIQIAEMELNLNDLRAQADTVREKLAQERASDEKAERELDPAAHLAESAEAGNPEGLPPVTPVRN